MEHELQLIYESYAYKSKIDPQLTIVGYDVLYKTGKVVRVEDKPAPSDDIVKILPVTKYHQNVERGLNDKGKTAYYSSDREANTNYPNYIPASVQQFLIDNVDGILYWLRGNGETHNVTRANLEYQFERLKDGIKAKR